MHNKPFPDNYDLRDGKRTVMRLTPARAAQIRDQNRTFYSSLRDLSSDNLRRNKTPSPTADQTILDDSNNHSMCMGAQKGGI